MAHVSFSSMSKVLHLHDSYQYLQPDENLWISNLHWTLGFPGPRWMHAPSLPSRSVRIVPMFVSGYCVHPNVLGPWSVIGLQGWTPGCYNQAAPG